MILIEDGCIKVPDVVDCASVRVVYPDGTKTTIPYVRKQPLEVVDGTVLQFLTGGSQVMCETRCDAPESEEEPEISFGDINITTLPFTGEKPEVVTLPYIGEKPKVVTLPYKGEAPEVTPLKEEDLQNLRIKRAWDA